MTIGMVASSFVEDALQLFFVFGIITGMRRVSERNFSWGYEDCFRAPTAATLWQVCIFCTNLFEVK